MSLSAGTGSAKAAMYLAAQASCQKDRSAAAPDAHRPWRAAAAEGAARAQMVRLRGPRTTLQIARVVFPRGGLLGSVAVGRGGAVSSQDCSRWPLPTVRGYGGLVAHPVGSSRYPVGP